MVGNLEMGAQIKDIYTLLIDYPKNDPKKKITLKI